MTRDHLPSDSHNVNHTAHASRQARSTSHTVNHGRYLPVRIAGRVGATTRAFPCRSTRRAGHLHRRVTRQPGHTIFRVKASARPAGAGLLPAPKLTHEASAPPTIAFVVRPCSSGRVLWRQRDHAARRLPRRQRGQRGRGAKSSECVGISSCQALAGASTFRRFHTPTRPTIRLALAAPLHEHQPARCTGWSQTYARNAVEILPRGDTKITLPSGLAGSSR
jgi:hypothetical protein